jgi:hypothetical protein
MIEFVNFLLQAVVIFFVVKVVLDIVAWLIMRKFKDQLQEIAENRSIEDNTTMLLDTSWYEGQIFCHNAITGDFVCQGKTIAEISKNFKLRHPDKNAVIQGEKDIIDTLKTNGSIA